MGEKYFIFYTTEGFTFQPKSEEDLPEVENCQVLGWGSGDSVETAFDNFKKENPWLKKLRFNFVIGAELKNKKTYSFSFKNSN